MLWARGVSTLFELSFTSGRCTLVCTIKGLQSATHLATQGWGIGSGRIHLEHITFPLMAIGRDSIVAAGVLAGGPIFHRVAGLLRSWLGRKWAFKSKVRF